MKIEEASLEQVKKWVWEIEGREEGAGEDDAFMASVVLLSSALIGPSIKRLATFTGYPRSLISEFSKNLRASGIWIGNKVCVDWEGEGSGISFICDSLVAQGMLTRGESEST